MNRKLLLVLFLSAINHFVFPQTDWPVQSGNPPSQSNQANITGSLGEYRADDRFHNGTDITGSNYNVYATQGGTASLVSRTPAFYSYIRIGDIKYYHITFGVLEGQTVAAGDLIGTMRTDPPPGLGIHVHYEHATENFLDHQMTTYDDNISPVISTHSFYVEGLTKNTTTTQLTTSKVVAGGTYTLIHNKVDIMVRATDPGISDPNTTNGKTLVPYQLSYELFDSEGVSVNGAQTNITWTRPALGDGVVNGFGPGSTSTIPNWILTSNPHQANASGSYNRYLNTRLRQNVTEDWTGNTSADARHNSEAVYKDGTYNVTFKARDVDDDATFNTATRNAAVLIDNFRPYVKEVFISANNEDGQLLYHGHWDWTGTMLKLFKSNYTSIVPPTTIWIKVIASEPLKDLYVRIPAIDGTSYRTMTLQNGTKNSEFTSTYTSLPVSSATYNLNFQGTDFNDNSLEQMTPVIPETDIRISIRTNATTWSPAPNPGTDQNHAFIGGGSFSCGPNIVAGKTNSQNEECLYVAFDASTRQLAPDQPVVFTNVSVGGTGTLTYAWNFGAGASPATATTVGPHTVTYTTTGSKNVSLTITDNSGPHSSVQNAFITIANPPPAGEFNASPTSGGAPLTVHFSAPTAPSWLWSFPGGMPSTSTQQNPVVTYSTPNFYDVTLTAGSVTNTKYSMITVTSVPPLTASINVCDNDYFINCGTSFNQGSSIYFSPNVAGGSPFYTYLWNFGDGNTSTQFDPIHSYLHDGNYTVTLTVTDMRGVSTSATTPVNVASVIPFLNVAFNISDTYITAGDGPVIFTDASQTNADLSSAEYYWDFGQGAYPRFAYTKGPHTVCYDNLNPAKSVYYRIFDQYYYLYDFAYGNVTVITSNTAHCLVYAPQWKSTPGAAAGGVPGNCLWPGTPTGIPNGTLESLTCPDPYFEDNTDDCPFDGNDPCFSGTFYGSHGDPSMKSDHNNSFRLWARTYFDSNGSVSSQQSEGIFYQHPRNFQTGVRYTFTFWARLPTEETCYCNRASIVDHFRISLTSGLTPATLCEVPGENYLIPTSGYSRHELGSFEYSMGTSNWACYEVYFYAPNNTFNQIWLYPEAEVTLTQPYPGGSTAGDRNVWVLIDDFSLRTDGSENTTCFQEVVVQSSTTENAIVGDQRVRTMGPVTVASGQNKTYRAGQEITLAPGFTASAGSIFIAGYGNCANPNGRDVSLNPVVDIYRQDYQTSQGLAGLIPEPDLLVDSAEDPLTLFPNPGRDQLTVMLNDYYQKQLKLVVYNVMGTIVFQDYISTEKTVNISQFATGMYVVKIELPGRTITKQFIKH